MGFIYLHKNNKDNCKVYIGQTIQKDLNKRWVNGKGYIKKIKDDSENGWHYGQPRMAYAVLNSDWDKDWDHRILEDLGDCTQEELNAREEYWIEYFDATNPLYGYNIRIKSEGKGAISEVTKKKMSEIAKNQSEEKKERISNTLKGHSVSEETRKKISESLKGRRLSKETIEKRSKTMTGRSRGPMSEEQKKKLSEAHKGRRLSEETRKKMSESHRRRNEK